MSGISRIIETLPGWLMGVVAFGCVAFIGFLDYLTGNYSLLIFYVFPIALASWYSGLWRGSLVALLSGLARLYADFAAFSDKRLLFWNSTEDALFLVFIAVLVVLLKKALSAQQKT